MATCCDHDCCSPTGRTLDSLAWRRALWMALVVNAGMFMVEIGAGVAADSSALQADSLDFLGDAANFAISLSVTSMALYWRARAALLKGSSLFALGLWVVAATALHAYNGTLPKPEVMGVVGLSALVTNGTVAVMLYRFSGGDANMRSAWICSRNDAIGNLAVLLAAAGVFGTGRGWPDLIVASIMAVLALSGGRQVIRHSLSELHREAQMLPQFTGHSP
jgi:Co/Zn/Cd efflux system component